MSKRARNPSYLSFLEKPTKLRRKKPKKNKPIADPTRSPLKAKSGIFKRNDSSRKKLSLYRPKLRSNFASTSSLSFWRNQSLPSIDEASNPRTLSKLKGSKFDKIRQSDILIQNNDDQMRRDVSHIEEWINEKKYGKQIS